MGGGFQRQSASRIWQAEQFLWRSWANAPVVYNISSGNTHTLTSLTAKILKLLEYSPQTIDQIAQFLAAENGVDSDNDLVSHVERVIDELDELGLLLPLS